MKISLKGIVRMLYFLIFCVRVRTGPLREPLTKCEGEGSGVCTCEGKRLTCPPALLPSGLSVAELLMTWGLVAPRTRAGCAERVLRRTGRPPLEFGERRGR